MENNLYLAPNVLFEQVSILHFIFTFIIFDNVIRCPFFSFYPFYKTKKADLFSCFSKKAAYALFALCIILAGPLSNSFFLLKLA